MQFALFAGVVLWLYGDTLLTYARDQYHQQHFLYLWVFLALALTRTLRGPFRRRFSLGPSPRRGRDWLGAGLLLLAALLLAFSGLAGSSSGSRTSLVALLTGTALLAVPNWSIARCLLHGLLLQLCFGVPQSVWFPLTSTLQRGVATVAALPARLGWFDYQVDATVVRFPHYLLSITPECSGVGQLLTFSGIAALGVLSGAPRRGRAIGLFALAAVLAWLSNMFRVAMFVLFVGLGWTDSVDDPTWHAVLGLLVFLPFVALLVAVILKTHRPIAATYVGETHEGRVAIAWLLVPLALAGLLARASEPGPLPRPDYFPQLERPPGHELVVRAPSEESDRASYQTPWLVNARFGDAEGHYFDLLHYATNSASHLCVHNVVACMYAPDQTVRRPDSIVVAGVRWWPIELRRQPDTQTVHLYYAFETADERRDDSVWTQASVFGGRMLGESHTVRFTRVVLPGPLPPEPTEYERRVLGWVGKTATGLPTEPR